MNRTLLIQIDLENAAFEGGAAEAEVLKVVESGFDRTASYGLPIGTFVALRDSNGNTVGSLRVCLTDDNGREA